MHPLENFVGWAKHYELILILLVQGFFKGMLLHQGLDQVLVRRALVV